MKLDEILRAVSPLDHEVHYRAPKFNIPQKGFHFLPVGELEYREPEFLLDGLIETDCLAMLFGDPAAGKSFVALDWAACISTGRAWKGRDTTSGTVIYLAGEGHNGIARRLAAWTRHTGQSLVGSPFHISTAAAQFLDEDHIRDVAEKVRAIAESEGDPCLIVIDTLSRNLGPGDENMDMAKFVQAVDELRQEYKCTVIIVHHSGHTAKDRGRGGSQLRAALDVEYRVTKPEGTPIVTIENSKMKDAAPPEPITLRLQDVEIGTSKKGEPVTSAVLVKCDPAEAKEATKKGLSGAKLAALQNFKEVAREFGKLDSDGKFAGLHVDDWREPFYAASTADSDAGKKKAFQRAKKVLVELGALKVENDIYFLAGQFADLEQSLIAEDIAKRGDNQDVTANEEKTDTSEPLTEDRDKGTTGGQSGTCPVGSKGDKTTGQGHTPLGVSLLSPQPEKLKKKGRKEK